MAQIPVQNGAEVEGNNSAADANVITSGVAVSGSVAPISDPTDPVDVYVLRSSLSGSLALTLESATDTTLIATVEDASSSVIGSVTRVGTDLTEAVQVPCGTDFFISVRAPSANSDYNLTATFTADPIPELSVASAAADAADTIATQVTMTASLSFAPPCDVNLTYTPSSQSATAGTDFDSSPRTLTIAAGQTTGTLTVPVTGDVAIEPDEDLLVTLSGLSGATFDGGGDSFSVSATIRENDGFVWDNQAYLNANPDLAAGGVTVETALDHYVAFGFTEGRRLSFDAAAYLEVNPDLVAAGITTANAVDHFIAFGEAEGRLTDANGYLNANPDLVEAGIEGAAAGQHFAAFGKTEGRVASFDAAGYLLLNPDLAEAGLSVPELIQHFNGFAEAEGRSIFDPGAYIAANPDVARTGADVYLHYQQFGQTEGRPLTPLGVSPGTDGATEIG